MAFSMNDRIPVDVMQEIFSWTVFLDITTAVRSRPVLRPGRSPFLLSWVCARWRAIALSDPSLWAHLELETYRLLHSPTAIDLYKLWMDRSSPHSLSISISEDYYSTPRFTDNQTVIDFLSHSATRCRYLHLSGPRICADVPKRMTSEPGATFPHLEGLFLSSGCFHSLKLDKSLSLIRFPNLRQLGITGAGSAGIGNLLQVYNANISHLSCEDEVFRLLRDVFRPEDFCSLVELDIHLLWSRQPRDEGQFIGATRDILELPHLRILTVSENFQLDQTVSLLYTLSTPRLSVLKITGDPLVPCDFLEPAHDFSFLEDFLARTPSLRRLELTHNLFHCETFFDPQSRIHAVPIVQLSVTVRIRPWADCWTYHGERYKNKGLDVVYEMAQGEMGLAQFFLTMLVGWVRDVKGEPVSGMCLGKRDVSAWKTSFWAGEAGKDYRRGKNHTLVKF